MDRQIKKILYGISYLLVAALFLWFTAGPLIKSTTSCSDGRQNQDETSVDCGGSCGLCEKDKIEPLRVIGEVKVFGLSSGRAVLLAEILNPNQNYNADSFDYYFRIHDVSGGVLETKKGTNSIYGSEKKHIYEADISSKYEKISRVSLELINPDWRRTNESLRPALSEPQSVITEVTDKGIRVSGIVRNQSPLLAINLRIVVVIFDGFEDPLFSSQTVLSSLNPFSEGSFTAAFPFDEELAQKVSKEATKVYISTK